MKKFVIVLLLTLSLSSCNKENNKDSYSNSNVNSFKESSSEVISSSKISSSINKTEEEKIIEMKNDLLKLNYQVSENTYSILQEDYYGITVEIEETGSTRLYDDNFIVKEFEQKIGDNSILGRNEIGIKDDNIYQLTYYGENDTNNSIKYYVDNDNNRKQIFDIGFVNEYVNNILDVTLEYLNNDENKISLSTNFEQIDLFSDGSKTLKYRFTSFAPNGKNKIEEVERDDILTIVNGKITKVKTKMLYELQDGVNYKYMEKEVSFKYEELVSYDDEKLNPNNI